MASVTVRKLSKRFGRVQALSGVDLEVAEGELCVLLGPSGCGKSTLLNIIAGLIPQDEGSVQLDGSAVDHLAPRERDVAMVFQNYALYPHMTVGENLSFGLRMRGVPRRKIEQQVAEVARLLGIEDLLERRPRELSGGQRQRVAMGRALVRRPRLFLLDEPLSNLDARLRAKVRVELRQLHQRIQGTILYVTHDQVEAMTLGDRVVVMRDGRIRQVGSPETIYGRPADTFVARFIGSPEMNLYRGRLRFDEHGARFEGRGFTVALPELAGRGPAVEVELGIRPEDVEVAPGQALQAGCQMISDVGAEKYLHGRLGEEEITVRLPKEASLSEGVSLGLRFPLKAVHLFRDGRRWQPPGRRPA